MIKSAPIETPFSKEFELYDPVARFLKAEGYRLQYPELPFYEYRIDIYSFSKRQDATLAVELKLTDWRRALEQALLYQLCADLVYVAMPQRSVAKLDLSCFSEHGVGIISVYTNNCCEFALRANSHAETRQFYRRTQIEYLRKFANA